MTKAEWWDLHRRDPRATPFGTGYRQQHGLQVRGGSETVRYFLSGEWEDEDGVTKVPEFEQDYLRRNGLGHPLADHAIAVHRHADASRPVHLSLRPAACALIARA